MKKRWIIIAAILAVVLAAVLLLIVLVNKNKQPVQDPDAKYEYSFRNDDKNVIVSIKGNFKEEYTWHVGGENENVVRVSVKNVTSRKTEILIEPVEFGVRMLVLSLENDDFVPDRQYELQILVSVDEEGKVNVLSSSHQQPNGKEVFGDDTDHPYEFVAEEDGSLKVYLRNLKPGTMQISCQPKEFASVTYTYKEPAQKAEGADQTERDMIYTVLALQPGDGTILLINEEDGKALKMELSADDNLMLRVEAHEMIDYDYEAEQQKAIEEEAEKLVGKLTMPVGSTDIKCLVYDVWEEDGTARRSVSYEFNYDGKMCVFMVTPNISAELMRKYTCMKDTAGTEVTVEGRKAMLYAEENAMVWMDGSVACSAITESTDALQKLAAEIIKANPVIRGTAE